MANLQEALLSPLGVAMAGVAVTGVIAARGRNTAEEEPIPPNEEALGPRGKYERVTNRQGLKLAIYSYPVDKPRAVLVVVHGSRVHFQWEWLSWNKEVGELSVYKDSWVQKVNKAGFALVGMDLQGHGRSESPRGLKGHLDSFEHFIDDFEVTKARASAAFPGVPVIPVGCSMGGCVGVNAVLRAKTEGRDGEYGGMILFAPMLSLELISKKGANPYLRPFAEVINVIAPTASIVANPSQTRFPEMAARFEADPMTGKGNGRVRPAVEYLHRTAQTMKQLHDVTVPFIVFQSPEDDAVDPVGAEKLVERAGTKDKTLRWCPGRWHGLTMEEGWEELCQEALDWATARV